NVALGIHAADDAGAANGDVRPLVGNQDGRADAMISAAGRIGSENAVEDRNSQMVEIGVAIERCSAGAATRVNGFLLHELDAAALGQPDQGYIQTLGQVGDHQDVLGLPGDPGPGHDLGVETDDDRPLAFDPAESVDDSGAALFVVARIVKRVQRSPGALVDQIVEAIVDGHSTALVDFCGGNPGVPDPLDLAGEDLLLLPNQVEVLLLAPDLAFAERLAYLRH